MDSFLYAVGIVACILIFVVLLGGAAYVVLQALRVPGLAENKADEPRVNNLWRDFNDQRRRDRDCFTAFDEKITETYRLVEALTPRLDAFACQNAEFNSVALGQGEAITDLKALFNDIQNSKADISAMRALLQRIENLEPKEVPSSPRTLR